ncbi:MAG: energy transducer TonB, partial [Verrucomicrobiota bacterium]
HDQHMDFSTVGFIRVEFYVLPDGTTEGVRTTELRNNVILESLTLDVLLKIKLPPPPDDVLSLRADRRVHFNYGFHVSPR